MSDSAITPEQPAQDIGHRKRKWLFVCVVLVILAIPAIMFGIRHYQAKRLFAERLKVIELVRGARMRRLSFSQNNTPDAIIATYGDNRDPIIRRRVLEAMLLKMEQANTEIEKVRQYEEILGEFDSDSDAFIQTALVNSSKNRAADVSIAAGRYEEAISNSDDKAEIARRLARIVRSPTMFPASITEENEKICDAILQQFRDEADPQFTESILDARIGKAAANPNTMERIKLYDQIIERYASSNDKSIQVSVHYALEGKTSATPENERSSAIDSAIAIYDKWGNISWSAWAMRQKAKIAKSPLDKIAIVDAIIEKWGKSTDPSAADLVDDGYLMKAEAIEDSDRKVQVYDILLERFLDKALTGAHYPAERVLADKAELIGNPDLKQAYEAERKRRLDAALSEIGEAGKPDSNKERVAVYAALAKKYAARRSIEIRDAVAPIIIAWADLTDSVQEKIRIYDLIIDHNPVYEFDVRYHTVLWRSQALVMRGNLTDDIEKKSWCYRQAVYHYNDTALWKWGAMAALKLADLSDKPLEKLYYYDMVIEKSIFLPGISNNSGCFAEALIRKAELINDKLEKLMLYDELIEKFGYDRDPELREYVAKAKGERAKLRGWFF